MRTNELVAGVRSDIAIVIYGPDLDELKQHRRRVAAVVRKVPGAVDVRVEQVARAHVPAHRPDRDALAQLGLTDRRRQSAHEDDGGRPRVGRGPRRRSALRYRRQLDRVDGDLDRVRALPLRSVSGQSFRSATSPTVDIVTGPARGQPREAVAPASRSSSTSEVAISCRSSTMREPRCRS